MNKIEGYIPKKDRKKILLLCDDIRVHSGVGTMAREFVMNSAHVYNWYQLGAAIRPGNFKIEAADLSEDINKRVGIDDADVKVLPYNGYGDAGIVRLLLKQEKPDAIFIFTDPRYWVWLFEIEREIRSKVPIVWLNIWDNYPIPLYNEPYYESVDCLMGISKQTRLINELVLGPKAKDKVIEFVPHGIDETIFKPLHKKMFTKDFIDFKDTLFNGKEIDFVFFFNSRNILRKHPHDLIFAFRIFCDRLPKEVADKCALIMHTRAVDKNGTDLHKVKEAVGGNSNIYFSQGKLTPDQLNSLYNIADATVLPSSNEGWGLSLTESMMAGTMIIANGTGGMQDQMRFEDENGEWFTPNPKLPSNHRRTFEKCGEWAIPVFPSNIALQGSVTTPYIFDDKLAPEDLADAMMKVYELPKEERNRRGLKGREWAMSEEAQMTAKGMTNNIVKTLEKTFKNFTPRNNFDIHKIEKIKPRGVEHELLNYSYD